MIDGYKELTPVIYGENAIKYLYTEQKKFKAKMNYADKLGVPYVVFLGDDEIAAGLVACKDMTSGGTGADAWRFCSVGKGLLSYGHVRCGAVL